MMLLFSKFKRSTWRQKGSPRFAVQPTVGGYTAADVQNINSKCDEGYSIQAATSSGSKLDITVHYHRSLRSRTPPFSPFKESISTSALSHSGENGVQGSLSSLHLRACAAVVVQDVNGERAKGRGVQAAGY